MKKTPKIRLASAVIIQSLRVKNDRTTGELLAQLHRHHLRDEYLNMGVRRIRDLFGDDALVCNGGGRGHLHVYTLNPKEYAKGRQWATKMAKRSLTEMRHVVHVLDWLVVNGVVSSQRMARPKRYAINTVAELEDLVSVIG